MPALRSWSATSAVLPACLSPPPRASSRASAGESVRTLAVAIHSSLKSRETSDLEAKLVASGLEAVENLTGQSMVGSPCASCR